MMKENCREWLPSETRTLTFEMNCLLDALISSNNNKQHYAATALEINIQQTPRHPIKP